MERILLKVTLNLENQEMKDKIAKINRRRRVNKEPYTRVLFLISDYSGGFDIFEETVSSKVRKNNKCFDRTVTASYISNKNVKDILDVINKIYVPRVSNDMYNNTELSRPLITHISQLLYVSDDYTIANIETVDKLSNCGIGLIRSVKLDIEKNIIHSHEIKSIDFNINWKQLNKDIEDASGGVAKLLDRNMIHSKIKLYCIHTKKKISVPVEMHLCMNRYGKPVYCLDHLVDNIDNVLDSATLSLEYVNRYLCNRINIPNINYIECEKEILLNGMLIPIYATPIIM